MTPEILREVIPGVLLRMKFKKKWEEHFENRLDKEEEDNRVDKEASIPLESVAQEKENVPPNTLERQHRFIGNLLTSLSIGDILTKSPIASTYYQDYQTKKILQSKGRNLITDLIINAAVSLKST